MGILIPWPVQRRRRAADKSRKGDAEILFFTGVRYVREANETDLNIPAVAASASSDDIPTLAVM